MAFCALMVPIDGDCIFLHYTILSSPGLYVSAALPYTVPAVGIMPLGRLCDRGQFLCHVQWHVARMLVMFGTYTAQLSQPYVAGMDFALSFTLRGHPLALMQCYGCAGPTDA